MKDGGSTEVVADPLIRDSYCFIGKSGARGKPGKESRAGREGGTGISGMQFRQTQSPPSHTPGSNEINAGQRSL